MSTRLTKPVVREVDGAIRNGAATGTLVVTLDRSGLVLRIKGSRHSFPTLPWSTLVFRAAQMEADQITRERKLRGGAS